MVLSRTALRVFAWIGLALAPGLAGSDAAAARGRGVAIADFTYRDTSGEPTDQVAAHRERLLAFMTALRRDFASDEEYDLVPVACAAPCMDDGPTPELLRGAANAGAKLLIVGGIHKQSTLVQWAQVAVIDVDANRIVFTRLFTFRGDGQEAWERAETFVSRELRAALAASVPAAAAPPVGLAIFDCELDDFSAGAAPVGETPSDVTGLMDVTNELRRVFAQSGRYQLVDVTRADAAAAKAHTLRDCDGCDAAIARKFGADQSLVPVVKRISRMEYQVQLQIRDARTGAVVADLNSGLRMGANYSWSRGAVQLIKDRLLPP